MITSKEDLTPCFDYVAVNWQIVQDVVERHVEVFAEYMREVEGWLGRSSVEGKK